MLINDYPLLTHGGYTQEIDHIFINRAGIFVIETKNWAGEIRGSEDSIYWEQILGDDDIFHKHNNPLKQNDIHAKKVQKVFDDDVFIYPGVVFVQNNIPRIKDDKICNLCHLRSYINSKEGVYMDSEVKEFYEILLEHKNLTFTTEDHIDEIKRLHS